MVKVLYVIFGWIYVVTHLSKPILPLQLINTPVISHSYLLCACENTSVLLWADLSDRTVSRVTHEVPRPPSCSREPVPLAALPFPQAPGLVSALRFRDSDFSCPGSAGAMASGPWVSPSDALAGQGGRGAPARCRERQDFRLPHA